MRYSEQFLEQVREQNDIVDVVGGYVKIQPKGGNYWGLCPFHREKTPSFSVSRDKQIFRCFGCGKGGNVITFLMEMENCSFVEAVADLAGRAGLAMPDLPEAKGEEWDKQKRLLALNKEAAKFFYYLLRSPKGEPGRQYLDKRGIIQAMQEDFGLGFSGRGGRDLLAHLDRAGYSGPEMVEAGLATYTEKDGLRPFFWNRVIFPIQDRRGRVIGFGGRIMGQGEPKYLNSRENLLFNKRRNLYGLHLAIRARSDYVILCEGYLDVIALRAGGYGQAVAALGTAFTQEQARIMAQYWPKAYVAMDSDGAGVQSALKALELLRGAGLRAKVIDLSPHKDPDEFLGALGAEALEERISGAQSGFLFAMDQRRGKYSMQDPEERSAFAREAAGVLAAMEEEVEREHCLQAVAQRYQIRQDMLRRLVGAMDRPPENKEQKPAEAKGGELSAREPDQELLLAWLAEDGALCDRVRPYMGPGDFAPGLWQRLAMAIFAGRAAGSPPVAADLVSLFAEEGLQSAAARILGGGMAEGGEAPSEKDFWALVCKVKEQSFRRLSSGGDLGDWAALLEEKNRLDHVKKLAMGL